MRIVRLGLALGTAIVVTVLIAAPASAKAMPEFIASGSDLPAPVFVSVDDVLDAVEGWVMGGDAARPEDLGPKYDLDVLQFQFGNEAEGTPPIRSIQGRWAYYPGSGGALTPEGNWVPFSPDLERLLEARISDGRQATKGQNRDVIRWAVGALALGLGFAAGRVVRSRGRAPLALPSREGASAEATAVA